MPLGASRLRQVAALPLFRRASWSPPEASGSVTYIYKTPHMVYGNRIGHQYDLSIQKQAGINRYVLNTSVQLPPGAKLVNAENVGSNLVLQDDAHVSVVYT